MLPRQTYIWYLGIFSSPITMLSTKTGPTGVGRYLDANGALQYTYFWAIIISKEFQVQENFPFGCISLFVYRRRRRRFGDFLLKWFRPHVDVSC